MDWIGNRLEYVHDWTTPGTEAALNWMSPGAEALVPYSGLLAPIVTLIVALAAIGTLRQKTRADASDEWWKRVEFALEKATDKDNLANQEIGTEMLSNLSSARFVWWKPSTWRPRWKITKQDREMISGILTNVSFPEQAGNGSLEDRTTEKEGQHGDQAAEQTSSGEEGSPKVGLNEATRTEAASEESAAHCEPEQANG